jgi:hypothetical protein
VLAIFALVLVLSAFGALVVAVAVRAATRRLGLELWGVLIWFGLAEEHDGPVRKFGAVRPNGELALKEPPNGRLQLSSNL